MSSFAAEPSPAPSAVAAVSPVSPVSGDVKQLFQAGKFEDAARVLEAHPADSASYFYNLGTINYRLGRLGRAVAYLEKANRLQSHDAATQTNLRAARAALERLLGNDKLDPASTTLEAIADTVAINEVRGGIGLLCLILALFWIRSYLKTRSIRETLLRPAGFMGVLALAVVLALYGTERMAALHPPAVALERQTVRSGPGDQFLELSSLEAGCKVRLTGTEEQAEKSGEKWLQVRFSADGIGWLRASSLLLL